MAITLTYLTTTVTLHEDMRWTNEFSWTPVQQATQSQRPFDLLAGVEARHQRQAERREGAPRAPLAQQADGRTDAAARRHENDRRASLRRPETRVRFDERADLVT